MRKIEMTVSFDDGSLTIGEESYTEWKEALKKLKKILSEERKMKSNKVWQKRASK